MGIWHPFHRFKNAASSQGERRRRGKRPARRVTRERRDMTLLLCGDELKAIGA